MSACGPARPLCIRVIPGQRGRHAGCWVPSTMTHGDGGAGGKMTFGFSEPTRCCLPARGRALAGHPRAGARRHGVGLRGRPRADRQARGAQGRCTAACTIRRSTRERMLLEAQVVNEIGHPNIVDIFEVGTMPDGRPYIVMERARGSSLALARTMRAPADRAHRRSSSRSASALTPRTPPASSIAISSPTTSSSSTTPSPATPRRVKVLDWGIAKVHRQRACATPRRPARRHAAATSRPSRRAAQAVTPQSDVYSLGVVAYELVLERPPFDGRDRRRDHGDAPADATAADPERAVARDPAGARGPAARDAGEELRRAADDDRGRGFDFAPSRSRSGRSAAAARACPC